MKEDPKPNPFVSPQTWPPKAKQEYTTVPPPQVSPLHYSPQVEVSTPSVDYEGEAFAQQNSFSPPQAEHPHARQIPQPQAVHPELVQQQSYPPSAASPQAYQSQIPQRQAYQSQLSQSQASEVINLTRNIVGSIGAHLRQAIIGRDKVIELLIVALLADGHVLLEDYPGSGKTSLAKALGHSIQSENSEFPMFQRIQFTPDLLPSDITGVSIFSQQLGEFKFSPGPIFTHIALADESSQLSLKGLLLPGPWLSV